MRVSRIESEQERCKMLEKAMIQNNINESHDDSGEIMKCMKDGRLQDKGFQKMMGKNPKQSLTYFRVLKREFYHGKPVTRLLLTTITGRTHQLRVHTAALGFPIISDTIYGINGGEYIIHYYLILSFIRLSRIGSLSFFYLKNNLRWITSWWIELIR